MLQSASLVAVGPHLLFCTEKDACMRAEVQLDSDEAFANMFTKLSTEVTSQDAGDELSKAAAARNIANMDDAEAVFQSSGRLKLDAFRKVFAKSRTRDVSHEVRGLLNEVASLKVSCIEVTMPVSQPLISALNVVANLKSSLKSSTGAVFHELMGPYCISACTGFCTHSAAANCRLVALNAPSKASPMRQPREPLCS